MPLEYWFRPEIRTLPEYDPNFDCAEYPEGRYDVVVSNYVLNVLPPRHRRKAIRDIAKSTGGVSFITVRSRRDTNIIGEPFQDGVCTSIGTFQRGYSADELVSELAGEFGVVTIVADSGGFVTDECRQPRQ